MTTYFSRFRDGLTPRLDTFLLATILLAVPATPAQAAEGGTSSVAASRVVPLLPLAEGKSGWTIGGFFSGLNNRTRIIQFCTVVMCLALYIMMRKFAPERTRISSACKSDKTPPQF
jgi:hypothetical protein